jgi:hypothetical protein
MATTTITELTRTYRKITKLIEFGCLPERIIETLRESSYDVLKELADAQPETWEFRDKVDVLVGALPIDPTQGWLTRVCDSLRADLLFLPLSMSELAQAAE